MLRGGRRAGMGGDVGGWVEERHKGAQTHGTGGVRFQSVGLRVNRSPLLVVLSSHG